MCALVTGVQTCALPICRAEFIRPGQPIEGRNPTRAAKPGYSDRSRAARLAVACRGRYRGVAPDATPRPRHRRDSRQDRKRVVEGESVSLRVKMGGSRVFKNKQETDTQDRQPKTT